MIISVALLAYILVSYSLRGRFQRPHHKLSSLSQILVIICAIGWVVAVRLMFDEWDRLTRELVALPAVAIVILRDVVTARHERSTRADVNS